MSRVLSFGSSVFAAAFVVLFALGAMLNVASADEQLSSIDCSCKFDKSCQGQVKVCDAVGACNVDPEFCNNGCQCGYDPVFGVPCICGS